MSADYYNNNHYSNVYNKILLRSRYAVNSYRFMVFASLSKIKLRSSVKNINSCLLVYDQRHQHFFRNVDAFSQVPHLISTLLHRSLHYLFTDLISSLPKYFCCLTRFSYTGVILYLISTSDDLNDDVLDPLKGFFVIIAEFIDWAAPS